MYCVLCTCTKNTVMIPCKTEEGVYSCVKYIKMHAEDVRVVGHSRGRSAKCDSLQYRSRVKMGE